MVHESSGFTRTLGLPWAVRSIHAQGIYACGALSHNWVRFYQRLGERGPKVSPDSGGWTPWVCPSSPEPTPACLDRCSTATPSRWPCTPGLDSQRAHRRIRHDQRRRRSGPRRHHRPPRPRPGRRSTRRHRQSPHRPQRPSQHPARHDSPCIPCPPESTKRWPTPPGTSMTKSGIPGSTFGSRRLEERPDRDASATGRRGLVAGESTSRSSTQLAGRLEPTT